MKLSVVIVNWNAGDDLGRCLASLASLAGDASTEVILVDNASRDGSPGLVARRFPWVRLVHARGNLGFARANNLAFGMARGRYLLTLNPDTIVHADALGGMVTYADEHPEVGFLGARLLNPDGSLQPSCRRFPSLGALVFRNTPLGRLFPRNRWAAGYLMEAWRHDRPAPVDWLSGACILVRREALEQIGPLDGRFFMFCEDMDWCRRAHLAGWPVVYLPTAVVTHRVGASTDHVPRRMIRAHHLSMWRYVWIHHGPLAAALAAPLLALRAAMVLCCRWR